MKIKAVLNRDGGTFKTTDMQSYCESATRAFAAKGHELVCDVVAGDEIVEALQTAVATSGVDAVIAGGGDGTISAAAGIAWKAGLPLGVVPAGTMNLFARSLKLPLDIWKVVDVLAAGEVASVDIATANGRPFVHQFSAGLHARMVRMRNQMNFASRLGKIRASTSAAFGVMLDPPRFEVIFDIDGDGRSDERRSPPSRSPTIRSATIRSSSPIASIRASSAFTSPTRWNRRVSESWPSTFCGVSSRKTRR